ncbi:MAG: endolytic transglycosylase MltG [Anaerovoracaceae bacterium]
MKKNMTKPLMIIAVAILVIVVGFFAFLTLTGRPMDTTEEKTVVVSIEKGSGTGQIAKVLKEKELIRSELAFKLKTKLSGFDGKYIAGTYAFNQTMTMKSMMRDLANGKTAGNVFTVIEGQTIDKVAQQLSDQGIVTKEAFYHEIENGSFDYPFMALLPKGPTRLEGFLYPNTYEAPLNATAHDVIDMMLASFDETITEKYYDEAEKQGKSLYEVITMASIVEREAAKKEEKPKVASVIANRLKIDMPLQMDSIIAYIQKEDKIRATYSDIAVDSAYNPYTNKGLPPGPICAPGKDAIEAALYPEDTDYLYFVAGPKLDGTNVYSKTYDEFLVNKAAFDKAYEAYVKANPEGQK